MPSAAALASPPSPVEDPCSRSPLSRASLASCAVADVTSVSLSGVSAPGFKDTAVGVIGADGGGAWGRSPALSPL
eukprot:7699546-Pyramimonas_sp.AAC.1